eukprot:scaffold29044_cov257-Skeletonema_menzelii.AAC.2
MSVLDGSELHSLSHLNPLPNLPDEGCGKEGGNFRGFLFFFVFMNPRSPVFDNEGSVSGACVVADEETP